MTADMQLQNYKRRTHTCLVTLKKKNLSLFPQPLKDMGHRQLPCLKAVLFYQSSLKSCTIMIHSRQAILSAIQLIAQQDLLTFVFS